ncbi:type II toxin-antitoxin system HicB family antitoxin [Bacteroides sp.]
MKLKKTDYVLECTSDGGYYAWLTVNMQCNAYGDSPEEAVYNLQQTIEELLDEMYLVEEFI